jgi:hypothetical protein
LFLLGKRERLKCIECKRQRISQEATVLEETLSVLPAYFPSTEDDRGDGIVNRVYHLQDMVNTNAVKEVVDRACPLGYASHGYSKRRSWFVLFPDLLCVAVMRFSMTAGHMLTRRDSRVVIEPFLDLSRLTTHGYEKSVIYRLYAVVSHRGSLSGGHYTCTARADADAKWYKYDDEIKKASSFEKAVSHKHGWVPYLLFYERVYGKSPTSELDFFLITLCNTMANKI